MDPSSQGRYLRRLFPSANAIVGSVKLGIRWQVNVSGCHLCLRSFSYASAMETSCISRRCITGSKIAGVHMMQRTIQSFPKFSVLPRPLRIRQPLIMSLPVGMLWWGQLVNSHLWAQELSLEHLLEMAGTHTQIRTKEVFHPTRLWALLPHRSYVFPTAQPAFRHTLIHSTISTTYWPVSCEDLSQQVCPRRLGGPF
jgi:hypothetical protein